jgi:hypothetical protein
MKLRLFFVGLISLLVASCSSHYPNLGDVPDYQKPSLSLEDAREELDELKAERRQAKDLALKVDSRA